MIINRMSGADYNGSMSALEEAIRINRELISQPFKKDLVDVELQFNIIEFWRSIQRGVSTRLDETPSIIHIARDQQYYEDLDDWCREVVWWETRKAHLYNVLPYGNSEVAEQLAGHF